MQDILFVEVGKSLCDATSLKFKSYFYNDLKQVILPTMRRIFSFKKLICPVWM